jgi:hypothetical protein
VLLSLLHRLVRCLLGLLAVLVRSDLSKDVEFLVLRQEDQVLRRQLGGRMRWEHAHRHWLRALSPAGEPPPMGGDLPGHASHDPPLAPSPGRPQVDLYRPASADSEVRPGSRFPTLRPY